MLQNSSMYSVLVFSRTKHGADKIHRKLGSSGIESISIHSGRTQGQRQRALDGFKSGKYQVMVATDIAARGIDVSGISHVINFDVPAFAEDYIHRIGRTGRATATGDAITFVSQEERKYLQQIEKFIGRNLHPKAFPGFTCIAANPAPTEPKKPSGSGRRTGKAISSAKPSAIRTKTGPARRRRKKARFQSA
jgi:ATP-dependent RNA helicase RhlE